MNDTKIDKRTLKMPIFNDAQKKRSISELRKASKKFKTITDMAMSIGISPQNLFSCLSGNRTIPLKTAKRLVRITDGYVSICRLYPTNKKNKKMC